MKKLICTPIIIFLFISLTGCRVMESKNGVSMEMVAYNSLTDEEKDLIPVSPKDSSVEKVAVSQEIVSMMDEEYEKDEVYRVIFNNSESKTSGKLVVFVDLDGETVVGKGFAKN